MVLLPCYNPQLSDFVLKTVFNLQSNKIICLEPNLAKILIDSALFLLQYLVMKSSHSVTEIITFTGGQ